MRKIPHSLREKMANDPFYKKCCFEWWRPQILDLVRCEGRIEWHHNLIFGSSQVNEEFCILPLCQKHHRMAENREIKEFLTWVMVSRATPQERAKYSKAIDYERIYRELSKKYDIQSTS